MNTQPEIIHYNIGFNPAPNPHQVEFLNLDTKINLFSGAFGSGKSSTICVSILMDAINYPRNRCLIARKQMVDLRKTTMKTFFDILPETAPIVKSWHKSDSVLTLINDSEIWFGGFDHNSKWKSAEIGSGAMDEATEFTKDDFLLMQSRLRRKQALKRKLYLACNPSHFEHWIYKEFYREPLKYYSNVESRSIDNKYLPADVIELYKSWELNNPDYYKRYVLGVWGLLEGVIYSNFNTQYNVLEDPVSLEGMQFFRAIDWGTTNPFVCLFIAIDKDDNIFIFDEFYQRGLTPIEAGNIVKNMHTDKHFLNTYADPSDPAGIQDFNNMQLYITKADNSVLPGIRMVMQKLSQIKIFPQCKKTIEEFQNYRWAETKADVNKPEHPYKLNDHTCLIGETKILMKDLSTINICDVKIGDYVKTPKGFQKVIDLGLTGYEPVYKVEFSNGAEIIGTGDHKIYTKRGQVRIDKLETVDKVIDNKFNFYYVFKVSPLRKDKPVYNITVENEHCYYANGILVANCDALRYFCYTYFKSFGYFGLTMK